MKKIFKIGGLFATFFMVASLFAPQAFAQVKTYPAPAGMAMSGDYIVKVGGKTVDVYRGAGDGALRLPYSFAYFDLSGSALVEITSVALSPGQVKVLPSSKGVVPTVNGNVVTFTLNGPAHLSIEPNGRNRPLLLFANPPEVNPLTAGSSTVKYYGPGLYKPGKITLTSGQTLYIAGGAVVQGGVAASGSNVTIRGRGILDGLPWTAQDPARPTGSLINCISCTNFNLDGIIVKDSNSWNVELDDNSYVNIKNLKIIADHVDYNDGLDIVNSQHVYVSDSFIRSDDDTIATKGGGWCCTTPRPAVDDITVTRSTLWTGRAHTWMLGAESKAPAMRNMLFKDIDVIHYDQRSIEPVIDLAPASEMPIYNVRFENIRINHEGQAPLIEIRPQSGSWSGGPAVGRISDIYFKDIIVTGNFTGKYGKVWVAGVDSTHAVNNVTFENLVRHGQLTQRTSPEVVIEASPITLRLSELRRRLHLLQPRYRPRLQPPEHFPCFSKLRTCPPRQRVVPFPMDGTSGITAI